MRVPVVERQTGVPGVPSPRVQPAEATGAGGQMIGRALEQLGQVIVERAREIKNKRDKTKTMEIVTDYYRRRTDYLYGENGVLRRKGPAADGSYAKSLEDLGAMRDEYLARAENDEQRFMLQSLLEDDIRQTTEEISRHEAGELSAWEDEKYKSTIEQLTNDVGQAAGDQSRFDASLEQARQILIAHYDLDPSDPEQAAFLEQQISVLRGNWHLVVLENLIKIGDHQGAQAWFEKYRNEIPGDKLGSVDQALREGQRYVKMQKLGAEILARFGWRETEAEAQAARTYIRENFEGEEEERLLAYYESLRAEKEKAHKAALTEKIQTIGEAILQNYDFRNAAKGRDYVRENFKDPEEREALLDFLNRRWAEDESEFLQWQSDTYDQTMAQIAAARSFSEAVGIINRSGLKVELQERLREFAADRFNVDLDYPGAPRRTDMKTLWDILDKAGKVDPKTGRSALLSECPTWQKFLDKYGGKLSISDQRQMRSFWESLTGQKKSEKEIDLAFSRVSMLNRLLDDAKIRDPVERAEAWKYVMAVVGTQEQKAGRELDPEEFTKWAEWCLKTIVLKKSFWPDPKARRYDVEWYDESGVLHRGLPINAYFDEKKNAWFYLDENGKLHKLIFK